MQVIAITSGKGGVGKTNIAVNLAVSMSREGMDVLLFDADLGLGNLDVLLGMSVEHTLADVMAGRRQFADVVVRGPEGLRVVPAAFDAASLANLDHAEQVNLVNSFSQNIDTPEVLIVDTGPDFLGAGPKLDGLAGFEEPRVLVRWSLRRGHS